ncbi:MAG: YhdH/YhfP family quinone oxidoreductase [Gammaproteobacteria bacterium]
MTSFTGLRVHRTDGDISSRMDTLEIDDLSAGDVVIRARYSSINYKDVLACTGKGAIMKSFPLVAGIDVAGEVHSSTSERFKPGDPVVITGCGLGETADGGYATYVRADPEWVVPLPNGLSLWETMCLGTAGFTAALAIERMERNGQTPDGGRILVTGASGGVGSLAVSMFGRLGYEVTALTGKTSAYDYLAALGADDVIGRDAVPDKPKPLSKALWGGALDNVGGNTLAWLTSTVDWWGNIASIGLVGGHALNTTVMPFILRGVNLLGVNSVRTPRPQRLEVWRRLASDLKPDLATIGTRTEAFADLPSLFQAYLDGEVTGRTVIAID